MKTKVIFEVILLEKNSIHNYSPLTLTILNIPFSEKEVNSTVLVETLESVSMQNIDLVGTVTEVITDIGLKSAKLDADEQAIVKKAGDAMNNAMNYFAEAFNSERINRDISEEEEKMEELEADPIFFLKDMLNDMKQQMFDANDVMSLEEDR